MKIAVITGSAGLIGSEAVRFFHDKNFHVVGIDNDMRGAFFGAESSTKWLRDELCDRYPNYNHYDCDIRDDTAIDELLSKYGTDVRVLIHTAAQPSHDWAARDPVTDFAVNANGTLTLLEATRRHCPNTVFIFTSTNKVYGDAPNRLPLIERETRWEIDPSHAFYERGIDESMRLDQSTHSLFGVSKAAADLLVQEYGRYFGMNTACFRGGCLTGPRHAGAELHGFLSYLMKCAIDRVPYTVFGYLGKQVRDNIHSHDLVNAFYHFYQSPGRGEVFNIGGGRHSNCSVIEAIAMVEDITGNRLKWRYSEDNRMGDHIWWISDMNRFRSRYPRWEFKYNLEDILVGIADEWIGRKT